MGRGGRGVGGGGRSGGRSVSHGGGRSGGGGRSSSSFGRSSSSSFRSGRSSSRGGYGAPPPPPRRGYGAPPPPPPRRRGYYHRNTASGCSSIVSFVFLVILILIIFLFYACNSLYGTEKYINLDVVQKNAEKFYDKEFGDRGDVFLFYITYSDKLDKEEIYTVWGSDCERYVANTYETFIDLYDKYYRDDVGIQLADALDDYTALLSTMVMGDKIEGDRFISKCYDDGLGYIDSKSRLSDSAERLYDATGIQFFVVTEKYDGLSGAKTSNTAAIVITVIVVIGIAAVIIIKKVIKENRERKKEEMEEQLKILNTPLETFGSENDIDNLAKKYDNSSSSSSSTASSSASVPTSGGTDSSTGGSDSSDQGNN